MSRLIYRMVFWLAAAVPLTAVAGKNIAPTVSLTAPLNSASFTAPATITLSATATATATDGSIAKVDFYQGTTLIGTATGTPYTYTWSNVPAASYTLRVIATDNLGASAISEPVVITVNRPPLVALTAPANCGAFDTSTGLDLNADAVDPDGHVVRVDYYADDVLVGSVDNPSSYLEAGNAYWFHWAGMSAGTYTLTARSIDNRGAVATSGSSFLAWPGAWSDLLWLLP